MEVFSPIGLDLQVTWSSAVSSYADYVPGQRYYRGDRVVAGASIGGDGKIYELVGLPSLKTVRDVYYPHRGAYVGTFGYGGLLWEEAGAHVITRADYNTDAEISFYPDHEIGTSYPQGARVYDSVTRKDYEALLDLSSAENDRPPSSAVRAINPDVSERWVELSTANGFACIDGSIANKTEAPSICTMTIKSSGTADRLAFFGLEHIREVEVEVKAGNFLPNPQFTAPDISVWTPNSPTTTLTHIAATNSMRVSQSDPTKYAAATCRVLDFEAGFDYEFSVTVDCAAGLQWYIEVLYGDLSIYLRGPTQTGPGTSTWQFTGNDVTHHLRVVTTQPGASTFEVQTATCKNVGPVTKTFTEDLNFYQRTTPGCKDKLSFGRIPGTPSERFLNSIIIQHEKISFPTYTITFRGYFKSQNIKIGLIAAGEAVYIGCTQADISVGGQQFHRIEEDEYGNREFLKRSRARELQAIVWLCDYNGDYVDEVMVYFEGRPCVWDFNNDTTDFERLRVHGWAETWETVVTGLPNNDYLSINMKGLVE